MSASHRAIASLVVIVTAVAGCHETTTPGDAAPAPDGAATFVGREACIGCHADVAAAYLGSDHDR
ncbi:MAG: hypothetical protein KDA25_09545, partial [Phycisphaerales bacterium]|nr:hypothetical protein [Phycisphaerales bacterium]